MIVIEVTERLSEQRVLLYEEPGKQGARRFVPAYQAFALNMLTKQRCEFAVSRDTSHQIFGAMKRGFFGLEGECPPTDETPYEGIIRTDGPVGFRIQLYRPGCPTKSTLIAPDGTVRAYIQFHFAPAATHGCFAVAGSRRDYPRNFIRPLMELGIMESKIKVLVRPRSV